MIDTPLPGMPEEPTTEEAKPPPGVHVSRYSPQTRTHCTDCIAEIHRLGVQLAALPRAVRWRVGIGPLTVHLCEIHKNERLEKMK